MQVESTELHLLHHSSFFHAKGIFPIDYGTFLNVTYEDVTSIRTVGKLNFIHFS